MQEFFHGWRRKIGVVTLLLACLFVGGWVRSTVMFDTVGVNRSPWLYGVASGFGQLHAFRGAYEPSSPTFTRISAPKERLGEVVVDQYGTQTFMPLQFDQVNWRWKWAGFHFVDGADSAGARNWNSVPYWSIVLPLAAISAYLILSRTQQSSLVR